MPDKNEFTLRHNKQRHLGQSEDWIFWVSLGMRTCNVWRKELSRQFVGHQTSFQVLSINCAVTAICVRNSIKLKPSPHSYLAKIITVTTNAYFSLLFWMTLFSRSQHDDRRHDNRYRDDRHHRDDRRDDRYHQSDRRDDRHGRDDQRFVDLDNWWIL